MHIDITPNNGIDQAIKDIVALGGKVKKGHAATTDHSSTGRSCKTHSATSFAWWTISHLNSRTRPWPPSTQPRTTNGEPPRESPATPLLDGTSARPPVRFGPHRVVGGPFDVLAEVSHPEADQDEHHPHRSSHRGDVRGLPVSHKEILTPVIERSVSF